MNEISFQHSLKSSDTEEWWDIKFNRPIGFFWAKCAIPLHITPNAITIASIIIGSAGSVLFYYDKLWLNVIGMLLLVLANTFDSADGQLARLTGQKTQLGRILDGLAGDIWFIIIYVALVLRMVHGGWDPVWTAWVLGSLAGMCHIFAAAMADYYRNVHLFFVNGKEGSEHDNSEGVSRTFREVKFSEQPFRKVSLWFYRNYTRQQEAFSPHLQAFWKVLLKKYPNEIPADLREDIRSRNRHFMPLTNLLQFNLRVAFLFLSLFLDMPWLYFLFDLTVMLAILIALILGEEKLFGQLTKELKTTGDK